MKPGSLDTLHFAKMFFSDNKFGIPFLGAGKFVETEFLPFNVVTKSAGFGVHCFVYDYYLERIWKRPEVYVKYLREAEIFFTPDFSLYTDIPIVLQMFNVYRSRWVGRYMQKDGVNVVPTISWSTKESFDFAFCGIQKKSLLAISTVGIKKHQVSLFRDGVEKMKEIIDPARIYVYGEKEKEYLENLFECTFIDSFAAKRRKALIM